MQPAGSAVAVDLDDVVTVTKLNVQNDKGYLMIKWHDNSFEIHLFLKRHVWKGNFSSKRLAGFSRNLQLTESDYFKRLKQCLSQEQNDYIYEIKCGFFYWKCKQKKSLGIEGFLPVEIDGVSNYTSPDLIEVLIALNKQLRLKAVNIRNKFKSVKSEYEKCLKDTEEFLNLKIEMEKTLCDKYLNVLNVNKSVVDAYDGEIRIQ